MTRAIRLDGPTEPALIARSKGSATRSTFVASNRNQRKCRGKARKTRGAAALDKSWRNQPEGKPVASRSAGRPSRPIARAQSWPPRRSACIAHNKAVRLRSVRSDASFNSRGGALSPFPAPQPFAIASNWERPAPRRRAENFSPSPPRRTRPCRSDIPRLLHHIWNNIFQYKLFIPNTESPMFPPTER